MENVEIKRNRLDEDDLCLCDNCQRKMNEVLACCHPADAEERREEVEESTKVIVEEQLMLDWMNSAMRGKQLGMWIDQGDLIFTNPELAKQWGAPVSDARV